MRTTANSRNSSLAINAHDIVYLRPLEVHQLRNLGSEPFGSFCIADHRCDRPQLLDPQLD